ncbi:hypothetical protein VTO42DRAFT_5269 [Malbranchea cinnamomea]
MFLRQAVLTFLLVAGFATSQVNPDDIPDGTKEQWCTMQKESCGLICLQFDEGDPRSNTCDDDTLSFTCVCASGLTPNASEYSQTIPYFLCTEQNNQCVANCGDNNICQSECRENNPCGAQNPTRINVTATITTLSPTASESASETTAIYDGFGDESSTDGDSDGSGAAKLLEVGQAYGLGVLVAGFLGGFALLL